MFADLRKEAAKFGANGIILGDVEEPTTGQKVAHALLKFAPANRKTKAIAVYVHPAGEQPTKPPVCSEVWLTGIVSASFGTLMDESATVADLDTARECAGRVLT